MLEQQEIDNSNIQKIQPSGSRLQRYEGNNISIKVYDGQNVLDEVFDTKGREGLCHSGLNYPSDPLPRCGASSPGPP